MDKLQWFKFSPSSWMMGRILRQPDTVQAAFMRLCCVYWNKECVMSIEDAQIECGASYEALVSAKIIKTNNASIIISFLDEQMEEIIKTSKKNRANALERWNKAKGRDATALQNNTTDMRPHATALPNNTNSMQGDASELPNDADKIREDKDKIRTDVDVEKPASPTTTTVSSEIKSQTPSEWLKELKPTVYITKYKNEGLPIEKIEEELKKFDDHYADTFFENVNHCLNVWGKWCKNIRTKEIEEHEAKQSQFTSAHQRQNSSTPAYQISRPTDADTV